MGSNWTSVPFDDNMDKSQFQHLGFLLKPVYDVVFTIVHLDQILISLARCLMDKWLPIEQLWVLLLVQ
jgi:hypothetical protein